MTELVVLATSLFIAEHGIGFRDLFEPGLGLFLVGGIGVGMPLPRESTIGFLDLFLARIAGDAQHLVVVSLSCHILSITFFYEWSVRKVPDAIVSGRG